MTAYGSAVRLRFVTEAGLASALIRFAGALGRDVWSAGGRGPGYSHVDAILDDGSALGARNDHVGGMPPGVQIRPPDYAVFTRQVIVEIPCTDDEKAAFYDALIDQIGKPYSTRSILGFVLGRDLRDRTGWFCNELVTWAGRKARIVAPAVAAARSRENPDEAYLVFSQAAYDRGGTVR